MTDLQTRKIEFVQEFLKLQSEDVIARFEKLLSKEKELTTNSENLITKDELISRIEQSEDNFAKGKFKTSSELLSKYGS